MSEEQKAQYAPTELVDFCIEYLPKFNSDMKYYNVNDNSIPDNADTILKTYREFVSINEGFINAHKASDIILPENLVFSKSPEEIAETINSAVLKQDLLDLLTL